MSTLQAPSIPERPVILPRAEPPSAPPQPPQSRGLWIAVLVGLAMVGGAMYWQKRAPQVIFRAKAGSIRKATVSRGPVARTLRLTGVTAAENFVSLVTPQLRGGRSSAPHGTSKQSGGPRTSAAPVEPGNAAVDFSLVLKHAVKTGSQVDRGEVVAEFDRQDMLNRVDDYRAVVTQSEADVKKQKAEIDVLRKANEQSIRSAQNALDRARAELQKIPVQSAIEAERTKLAFDEAEARYEELLRQSKFLKASQEAEIRNSEFELDEAKLALGRSISTSDQMVARSPISGTVVMQSVFRSGELAQIQEGDQLWSGVVYLQVVDPSSMVVNAWVNQVDVEKLRLGQRATIRLDAYSDLELPAHLVAIAAVTKPAGGRASFVKEVPVKLKIDRKDPRVIPDLSISADVSLANDDTPAAVVPAGAVFRDEYSKPFVYVQDGSFWRRRDVEVGLTNHLQASVRSGLKPGEVVALDRPGEKR